MHRPGRPPSIDILLGTPRLWTRLGREDALRLCRTMPVAVAYVNLGQWVSAWLSPESPFYTAYGPYDYASLRYFLFAGGIYAILHYFEASFSAALVGIFVAVAAVLLEILFELIYGT